MREFVSQDDVDAILRPGFGIDGKHYSWREQSPRDEERRLIGLEEAYGSPKSVKYGNPSRGHRPGTAMYGSGTRGHVREPSQSKEQHTEIETDSCEPEKLQQSCDVERLESASRWIVDRLTRMHRRFAKEGHGGADAIRSAWLAIDLCRPYRQAPRWRERNERRNGDR
jgi:hypothetical protein